MPGSKTKNYRELRNTERWRNTLPQGGALPIDYLTPNEWAVLKTYTSNLVCTEQDVFIYLVTYMCNIYFMCIYNNIIYYIYNRLCTHVPNNN